MAERGKYECFMLDGPVADHIFYLEDLKPKTVSTTNERWEYSYTGKRGYRGVYEFKVTNHWKGRLPTLTNLKEGD